MSYILFGGRFDDEYECYPEDTAMEAYRGIFGSPSAAHDFARIEAYDWADLAHIDNSALVFDGSWVIGYEPIDENTRYAIEGWGRFIYGRDKDGYEIVDRYEFTFEIRRWKERLVKAERHAPFEIDLSAALLPNTGEQDRGQMFAGTSASFIPWPQDRWERIDE